MNAHTLQSLTVRINHVRVLQIAQVACQPPVESVRFKRVSTQVEMLQTTEQRENRAGYLACAVHRKTCILAPPVGQAGTVPHLSLCFVALKINKQYLEGRGC